MLCIINPYAEVLRIMKGLFYKSGWCCFHSLIYQYAAQQRHANLAFSVSVSFYSLFNYALKGIWSAIFTSCADSLVFSLPCFSHPFQKLLPGFYTNDVIIILLRNRTRMSV